MSGNETKDNSVITRRDFGVSIVSLLVSGVGGVMFERWISRARPSIKILSFGFEEGDYLIPISKELRQMSKDHAWINDLDEKLTFGQIRTEYSKAEELIKKHENAIEIAESWLKGLSIDRGADASRLQLNSHDIDAHPYFQETIVISSIIGSIRRSEMQSPPTALLDLKKMQRKFDLHTREDGGYKIEVNFKSVGFPSKDMNTDKKKEMLKVLAESFAVGSYLNLRFYAEYFLSQANSHLLKLKKISELLRFYLIQEAHLTINVALHNDGNQAMIFRQYFLATLVGNSFSYTAVMGIAKEDTPSDENESHSMENILPNSKHNQMAAVSAGELTEVKLQSTDKLGSAGEAILSLFRNGALECNLFGITNDGSKISAAPVSFGRDVEVSAKEDMRRQSNSP